MNQSFPESYKRSNGKCKSFNIKVDLDLSNYATKVNSKKKQVLIHQI